MLTSNISFNTDIFSLFGKKLWSRFPSVQQEEDSWDVCSRNAAKLKYRIIFPSFRHASDFSTCAQFSNPFTGHFANML